MSELRAGTGLRWSRAALITAVAMGTGTAAHVSAGGQLPRAGLLAGMALLATVGCAALLGRPASVRRIVLLTAGGQAMCHLLLTAVAGHRGTVDRAPSTHGVEPDWMEHIIEDVSGPNLLMASAHLAAAAAVGWWLSTGEQALWSLMCLMRRRSGDLLQRLLTATRPCPVLSLPREATTRTPSRERPVDRWQIGRRPARRGPPPPVPAF